MNKTGIIAFCGAKGSGKDTSAGIFKSLIDFPVEEVAFAGHLKTSCSKAFNVDMKYFLDPKLKEVELDYYVVLSKENIIELISLFELTGIDYDTYIRPHVGSIFYTGRSLLQYIGTEVLHPINPLIHVETTLRKKDPNKLTIVTDLRFPQEFAALEARQDYIPVFVDNVGAQNAAAGDTHASEQGWKIFKDRCYRLDNNGNIQNLTNRVKDLVEDKYEV